MYGKFIRSNKSMHVINAINNLPNNLIWNSICSYIWVQSLFCVGMMVARLPLLQNSVYKYIIEKFTITLTKICLQYKGWFLHASYLFIFPRFKNVLTFLIYKCNLPLKIERYSVLSNFKWKIFFKFCGLLRISELY